MHCFLIDGIRTLVAEKFGIPFVAILDEKVRNYNAEKVSPSSSTTSVRVQKEVAITTDKSPITTTVTPNTPRDRLEGAPFPPILPRATSFEPYNECADYLEERFHTGGYLKVTSEYLGITAGTLMQMFGEFWGQRMLQDIIDEDHTFPECIAKLENINIIHDKIQSAYPKHDLHFPRFEVEKGDYQSYTILCYCSVDLVLSLSTCRGIVLSTCKQFNPTISVQGPEFLQASNENLYHFNVKLLRKSDVSKFRSQSYQLNHRQLLTVFPFHFIVDCDLFFQQVGPSLLYFCPSLDVGKNFLDFCEILRPNLSRINFSTLVKKADCLYNIKFQEPGSEIISILNGQMVCLDEENALLFLVTPTLDTIRQSDLSLFDLPIYSRYCDFDVHLKEVELDTSNIVHGNKNLESHKSSVLSLPTHLTLAESDVLPIPNFEDKISVYQMDDSKAEEEVDLTTPVQKVLSSLHILRSKVNSSTQAAIDKVVEELVNPDMYLPSIEGNFDRDDEFTDYVASFFPRQSSLKFDQKQGIIRTMSVTNNKTNKKSATHRRNSEGNLISIREQRNKLLAFQNVERAGFLDIDLENSSKKAKWEKFYFVLEDGGLTYFRSNDPHSLAIRTIDLSVFDRCQRVERKTGVCMELSSSDPTTPEHFYLHANNVQETNNWMNVIVDALAKIRITDHQNNWDKMVTNRVISRPRQRNTSNPPPLTDAFDAPTTKVRSSTVQFNTPIGRASIVSSGDVPIDYFQGLLIYDWHNHLDSLEFDVFKVAELSNDRPLQVIGKAVFEKFDLCEKFDIPESKLNNFLRMMEKGYFQNNYHNAIHAADVLQTLYYFLTTGKISQYLADIDILSAVVAAIIHDYMHPGVNNGFHINSRSPEAMLYNDQSVLENVHLAKAFQIITQDDCNIFCGLSEERYKHVRTVIIQMVLNTDMSRHFELTGKFQSAITITKEAQNEGKELANTTIMLILSMALHCADVSNPVKNEAMCQAWAVRIMNEFWNQGDRERSSCLCISPFMDRTTSSIEKCQLSFISFIVEPLFKVFQQFCPEIEECMVNLKNNKERWAANLPKEEEPTGGSSRRPSKRS